MLLPGNSGGFMTRLSTLFRSACGCSVGTRTGGGDLIEALWYVSKALKNFKEIQIEHIKWN